MDKSTKDRSDKRAQIAEGLVAGESLGQIRARLMAAGTPASRAEYELRWVEKDPLFQAAATLQRRIAKRDWSLRIHTRLAAQRAGGLLIPRIHAIDPGTFFDQFYAANRPAVLTGLVDHWPALSKWSLEYFAKTVGDAVVELQADRTSADDYELAKDRHRRVARMRDVIEAIGATNASNDFYVTAYNDTTNRQTLAPLWDDLGDVSILRSTEARSGFFWFGPKGTLTPFHHDLTNNLLVQVLGSKRVQMVASWEVGRMLNSVHCFSGRSPADWPTGEDLPPLLECVIGPGDALFLPVGWWHHVEALDVSVSMSFTNFAADNDFFLDYPSDSRF